MDVEIMRVPAACRNCGTIFPTAMISGGAATITFQGCTSGPCPQCGGVGDIIDGTFNFLDNAIVVREAPPKTIQILSVLQEALRQGQNGASAEEVIRIIAESSPEAAEQAFTLYSRGGLPMLLTFIFLLLSSCANNTKGTINWNQAFDQAKIAILGGNPYPGLGSDQVGAEPSAQEEQDPQSRSEEKSSQNKPRQTRRQHQTKTQSVEIESPSSTGSLPEPSKSPGVSNRAKAHRAKAERRKQMRGYAAIKKIPR